MRRSSDVINVVCLGWEWKPRGAYQTVGVDISAIHPSSLVKTHIENCSVYIPSTLDIILLKYQKTRGTRMYEATVHVSTPIVFLVE